MKKTDVKISMTGLLSLLILLCSLTLSDASLAQSADESVDAAATGISPVVPSMPTGPTVSPPAVVTTPAAPSAPVPAPVATPAPSAAPSKPSDSGLVPSLSDVPGGAQGSAEAGGVMGDTGVTEKHSGTYYDSNATIPDSDLLTSGATGPRKLDPAVEPGQKFVVVEKTASAGAYEAQYVAATRALKLGRYAAAMEMFEKLHKKNRRDPRILMGLAVAQQGAGFYESATQTYEDLLAVEPNNADAIVNLMGLMRNQYPSVTLKRLSDLGNKYPSNPGIPAQMGLISAEMKMYDEAMRYLEMAASMDPRSASHVYNMAIVAERKGDVASAIKFYEQALQLDATYGDAASALPREKIYDRLVILRRKV